MTTEAARERIWSAKKQKLIEVRGEGYSREWEKKLLYDLMIFAWEWHAYRNA